jgi:putative endonuclease
MLQCRIIERATAMHERYAVYILASRKNGTLYIGITSNLLQRVEQHKAAAVPGFTRRYGVTRLVHVERYAEVHEAIAREKQLKGWNRAWKIRLIERSNPEWIDLDPTAC